MYGSLKMEYHVEMACDTNDIATPACEKNFQSQHIFHFYNCVLSYRQDLAVQRTPTKIPIRTLTLLRRSVLRRFVALHATLLNGKVGRPSHGKRRRLVQDETTTTASRRTLL